MVERSQRDDGPIMAYRRLSKRTIIGSVILALAVLVPVVAYARYVAPSEPDGVEAAANGTSTGSNAEDHIQSAIAALRDMADLIAGATTSTTEPALPTTTQESPPPTADGDSTSVEGNGEPSGSTTTCPLPAYPDARCTGVPAGNNLTVHNGDLDIGTANTVIDGQDIRGCVRIHAPGVVIRRSKITCGGPYVVGSYADDYSGTGLVLEDVEISCSNVMHSAGVGDHNFTVRRADIHSCENGFDVDGHAVIEHSYIHDLIPYDPNNPADVAADPHSDGAQITPIGNDITFRHNTIYAGDGTSAIISPDVSAGVVSNVLITDNLMAGGAATLYCQQNGSGNNYRVINNHFSTLFYPTVGAYYAWVECEDEIQVTGNVFHESGRPVPL
jgi:hypothetical protein